MKIKQNRNVVLLAGMLIQLCAGIIYMWSVFRKPVSEYLGWDIAKATLTSSVMLSAFVLGIIIGGRMQDKIGPKKVVLIGSIIMSAGILISAFVSKSMPSLMYLTYGAIGGLGVGFVYTTAVSVVQKWFPDKRGFATGMMVSAFGFSLVIFAPVVTALLGKIGVPNTFISIGVLFLVVCSLASLLIDNPQQDYAVAGAKAAAKTVAPLKHFTTKEMLKTKQFYLIAVSMMFILPAYFILNPLFKDLAVAREVSEQFATVGVMLTGICSASGRLIFSWLSDLIGRKGSIIGVIGVTLAAVLLLTFAKGPLFLICIGAIAFAFGGSAGVFPAITADNYGTKYMGLNYGCVMVGFGISALLFPIISSKIAVNGNYTPSFILSAATCVLSLILILLVKQPKKA